MTPEHKEYRRRKAELDTRYKSPFAERWFGWWRNGPDRFAFLIALFTFALFAATAGLWLATNSLVEDARDSGRAWIGPADARLAEGIQKDKAVKIAIQYTNTGRQPAPYVLLINGKVFGEKEWEDGTAVQNIIASQKNCMGIDALNNPIARVAYPTSGFSSFQMTFDSEYRYLPEKYEIYCDPTTC
jgi:hypothetical protein